MLFFVSLSIAVGYAYFDIFSQNAQGTPVRLVSPSIPRAEDRVCFSFW